MAELREFRQNVVGWLNENCPDGAKGPGQQANGSTKITLESDVALWLERCAEKGFTAPTWPTEYGGGGLSDAEAKILYEEMGAINARTPLVGMGMSMIGPTLLEYGNDAQKAEHLPKIIRGEVQWCQGYSEPNAGSDLAALSSRAEDHGDHYVINGQKIWTSGAATADWMFALVRTDFDAPKHEGISFVLLTMDQPGVTVKPIRLISGSSPFCETFFDNAIASKDNLIGDLNKGWTVGKRLLQFERSGIGGLSGGARPAQTGPSLADIAKQYIGENDGRISDPAIREQVTALNMNRAAFRLTALRANAENKSGTPGAATSIFKFCGAALQQDGAELKRELMGFSGLGADDAMGFSESELTATEEWLHTKATTIYGGSNEIQANIIAKRVLGLPE
ncbi:MAG TPA: acyl-CoA dehydrogenase [Gammaproteobacteria bacterium]|nr:acyl-CoA dehydrogenase [Gammaproteobacteria bacterium]|tara:strand:+ start:2906 stop:4087 length:1182 start_codon:yes stop_codon:yes gene_type:complete